jgi:hypothetical protein
MTNHVIPPAAGASSGDPASECRIYERYACEVVTSCQPPSAWVRKDARWSATIRDISCGGIRLQVRRRFEPGSGLAIELPGSGDQPPYIVLARVVHATAQADGSWFLGCAFVSALSDEEVLALVPPPKPAEKPAAPARVEEQKESPSAPAPLSPSPGRNLLAGVRLHIAVSAGRTLLCDIKRFYTPATWPLTLGQVVTLRGGTLAGGIPEVRLRVLSCAQQGQRWVIHCQFDTPPSPAILRALGH